MLTRRGANLIPKLDRLKTRITSILVVCVIAIMHLKDQLFGLEEQFLSEQFGPTVLGSLKNYHLTEVIALVGLVLLYTLTELLVHSAVDRWRWVRRLALGKDEIQDVWIDVVIEDGKIVGCGYNYIEYDEGRYIYRGNVFDRKVVPIGSFRSTLLHYEKKELNYNYEFIGAERGNKKGHGTLYLHGSGGRVWNYGGQFYEDVSGKMYFAEGIRLREYIVQRAPRPTSLVRGIVLWATGYSWSNPEYRAARDPRHIPALLKEFMDFQEARRGLAGAAGPESPPAISLATTAGNRPKL